MRVPLETLIQMILTAPPGTTSAHLAVQSGYTVDCIARRARRLGVRLTRRDTRRWSSVERGLVEEWVSSGLQPVERLAEALGRSKDAVLLYLAARNRPQEQFFEIVLAQTQPDARLVRSEARPAVAALMVEQRAWTAAVHQAQALRLQRRGQA